MFKTQFWDVIVLFFLVVEVLLLFDFIVRGFLATSFFFDVAGDGQRRPASTKLRVSRSQLDYFMRIPLYFFFSVCILYWWCIFGNGSAYFASLVCLYVQSATRPTPFFRAPQLVSSRCFCELKMLYCEYFDDIDPFLSHVGVR